MKLDPIYYNATRKLDLIKSGIFNEPIIDIKKQVYKKPTKVNENKIVQQPLPITINNFFIRTKGTFKEIKTVPISYLRFFKSKGSEYYTNNERTKIVRVSDHWGSSIKLCTWYLESYDKINCGKWKKTIINPIKIGIIDVKDLKINKNII